MSDHRELKKICQYRTHNGESVSPGPDTHYPGESIDAGSDALVSQSPHGQIPPVSQLPSAGFNTLHRDSFFQNLITIYLAKL